MIVSAPGKMMISGEYAVLEGAPAIVAAVQTRATAMFEGEHEHRASETRFPEALASAQLAAAALGTSFGDIHVDVSELRRAGQKLGVGSSSAAAAAGAALVYAKAGRDLEADRSYILSAALEGHRKVAPEGSGADVAACVLGGFVRYRRRPVSWLAEADPLDWPEGLVARIAWTGSAASTRDLVAKVHALRDSRPDDYRVAMDRLAEQSEYFIDAFVSAKATIRATHEYYEAMQALGEAADAPIVEERLQTVSTLAQKCNGAAKPSGAGGGDVALAVFRFAGDAENFDAACAAADIEILQLELGGPGVRVD